MQLTMAQDEHSHRYSNIISGSGGGGGGNRSSLCSSKKQKQNRIPQRGLGVAQLEKIRLEEQQKREPKTIAITTPSPSPSPSSDLSIISSTNTSSSSSMAVVQHPNIGPNVVIPSTSQSHSQSYLSVQTPMNGQPSSIMPNLPMNVNIAGGKYMGFPAGGPMEQDHLGILNHGFGGFVSNTGLPYESNTVTTTTITIPPIWPTPIVMQRPLQFQQPYSSLMVNVLTSSSPSTPGINYQMDLPSSQSYSGNIYPSTNWPEEEKIVVGMKRPYSFSIDNAPGPCFPPPPTTFLSPLSRSDDSASCSHRIATTNTEPPNPVPRELTLISGGVTERNPKRMMTGTGGLSGEFLTLGQSRTLNPSSSSIIPHQRPDFGSLPYQCGVENLMYGPRQGPSGSTQLPFINFLPPKETDNRNSASNVSSSGNGEKRGSVDTKLKL